MSATQATVTNMQVAVKYRRKVSSLSINMSADNRTTTLGRHIGQHISRVPVNISPDAQLICRLTHLGRHIDWHSTDMSTDTSVKCRPISRSRGAQNTHDLIFLQNTRESKMSQPCLHPLIYTWPMRACVVARLFKNKSHMYRVRTLFQKQISRTFPGLFPGLRLIFQGL